MYYLVINGQKIQNTSGGVMYFLSWGKAHAYRAQNDLQATIYPAAEEKSPEQIRTNAMERCYGPIIRKLLAISG